MAAIDVVFLAVLALLTLRAFLRGFTGEIFSIASLTLGIFSAVFFFKNGAVFLRTLFFPGLPLVPEVLSFIILFLSVFVLGKILERIVKDIVNRLKLGALDSFLGFLLGIAEGIAVIALILIFITVQPLFNAGPLLGESLAARILLPLIGIARTYV